MKIQDLENRYLIGRDLLLFHAETGEYWRGPLSKIEVSGSLVSFQCEWIARCINPAPWTLCQKGHEFNPFHITEVDSAGDPRREVVIIKSPVGYIYIEEPGDSLEKPATT